MGTKPIEFNCKVCQAKLAVPSEYAGKTAACPKCGKSLIVPSNTPSGEGSSGPDFSSVVSMEQVVQLAREGTLVKLFLLPPEFGGVDDPCNVVPVPAWVEKEKATIDNNVVANLVNEGKVTQYSAVPEYQGDSHVPIALKIRAWDPQEFNSEVRIWGDALKRQE